MEGHLDLMTEMIENRLREAMEQAKREAHEMVDRAFEQAVARFFRADHDRHHAQCNGHPYVGCE